MQGFAILALIVLGVSLVILAVMTIRFRVRRFKAGVAYKNRIAQEEFEKEDLFSTDTKD